MLRALIIEDNLEVLEAVSLCFKLRWPEVSIYTAMEGRRGIEILQSTRFDIIILDLNLPDMDGLNVLSYIRSSSSVPVIILTVRGTEEDQAKGLEMGADDYIVKPFRQRDLIARVNAVIRRASTSKSCDKGHSIVCGKLTLNLTNAEILFGDQLIKLTPSECRLLYLLMQNADQTTSSEQLLTAVWNKTSTDTELLRTYIRRLRSKLNDKPPQIILTERREGYRLVTPK